VRFTKRANAIYGDSFGGGITVPPGGDADIEIEIKK
jgi:hypothetical protein